MGLSENEQRILDELESQLRQQDPALARRASRLTPQSAGTRSLLRAAAALVFGLGLLLLLTIHPAFAVVGAALMLYAFVLGGQALSAYARTQADQARQKASRSDEA